MLASRERMVSLKTRVRMAPAAPKLPKNMTGDTFTKRHNETVPPTIMIMREVNWE
jgi:hypothetical protein